MHLLTIWWWGKLWLQKAQQDVFDFPHPPSNSEKLPMTTSCPSPPPPPHLLMNASIASNHIYLQFHHDSSSPRPIQPTQRARLCWAQTGNKCNQEIQGLWWGQTKLQNRVLCQEIMMMQMMRRMDGWRGRRWWWRQWKVLSSLKKMGWIVFCDEFIRKNFNWIVFIQEGVVGGFDQGRLKKNWKIEFHSAHTHTHSLSLAHSFSSPHPLTSFLIAHFKR